MNKAYGTESGVAHGPTGFLMPMVVEKTSTGERGFDLPSRLMQDRIILLTGVVTTEMAYSICAQLRYLDSISSEPIEIIINSPGGSVLDGLAIIDTMRNCRCVIRTVCNGLAASMGCYILAIGTPGHRFASQRATIMAHQVSSGTDRAQMGDLAVWYAHTAKLNEQLGAELAKCVGMSFKQYMKTVDRDNYMSAEEARDFGDFGFVDGVIIDNDPLKPMSIQDRIVRRVSTEK